MIVGKEPTGVVKMGRKIGEEKHWSATIIDIIGYRSLVNTFYDSVKKTLSSSKSYINPTNKTETPSKTWFVWGP